MREFADIYVYRRIICVAGSFVGIAVGVEAKKISEQKIWIEQRS